MWNDYRKRPVVVQAVRLTYDNVREVGVQIGAHRVHKVVDAHRVPVGLSIPTLEGSRAARIGDYIIKDVDGEFYPCKASIFVKGYELSDG